MTKLVQKAEIEIKEKKVNFLDAPYPVSLGNAFIAHPSEIAKTLYRPHRPCYYPKGKYVNNHYTYQ